MRLALLTSKDIMQKKVVLLIDGLGSGGAQTQLITLAYELSARKVKVVIVCYHDESFSDQRIHELGLKRIVIPRGHGIFSKALFPWRLRRFFSEFRPSAVIAYLEGPSFYAEMASLFFRDYQLIVSERFMTDERPSFRHRFLYLCHLIADHLVVNSQHQTFSALRSFPWIRGRVTTIFNGYPKVSYDMIGGRRGGVSSEVRFLVVSSLAAKKNPLNLIRALGLLHQKYPNVSCVWVGRYRGVDISREVDSEMYDQCMGEVFRLGLSEVIEFVGEQSDMARFYTSAEWLIHPSYKEGFPNVICEALGYGLPVLASRVGDHSFLVSEHERGFLFAPESPEAIYLAMEAAMHCDTESYTRMSRNCAAFFEEELSSDRLAAAYMDLF